ncbi:tetratricopeptide repeat protein [Thermocrinis minervae]|uniref:Tetratricopeptide repeat-containing protein n=1 Tax=Thermocrinis minervae TaxID=381751 RepID=A0A1M6Q0C8_9AQUI|nr:tetratricopeptide repeat protein [Thermocrinis minervae]SHK13597.1 Tetratricopeptide repeat-containing protein [Thermocrinis minervae]
MKARLWTLIGLVVILAIGLLLLIVWNDRRKQLQAEASYKEYALYNALQKQDYQKAKELIKQLEGTPFEPLALSYYVTYKELGGDKIKVLEQVEKDVKDPQIKKLYTERLAFELYVSGKKDQALKVLEGVQKDDFNYPSALLLKAQILNDPKLYLEVKNLAKDGYLSNLAQALLLTGR